MRIDLLFSGVAGVVIGLSNPGRIIRWIKLKGRIKSSPSKNDRKAIGDR